MNERKQMSDPTADDRDDLQQIKGIGRSVARALSDLGIDSYADLISSNPDHLAALLKESIRSVSPQRIEKEDWIGQARLLAGQEEDASRPEVDQLEPASASAIEPDANAKEAAQDAWRELADFFVSFGHALGPEGERQLQTRVHHSQGDKSEQWEGIAPEPLFDWMLGQAQLAYEREPEKQPDVDLELELGETQEMEASYIDIADLWVTEVKVPAAPGYIEGQAALLAEGRLELSGPQAVELTAERIPYTLDLHLVNMETNHSELVATRTDQLMPDELIYDINQDFPIPAPGRYQLYIVARISPPGATFAYVQGPQIRVEP